ncbi:hypothetical protein [Thalassobellus citreus]|uniref:hypothetical protein n=1 Tax=Thalassobellus citreus TaxID=3367752 RepID=UPI0037B9F846
MKALTKNWKLIVLLCISLGLAPFSPEPHIVGKFRWIIGGAKGMQLIDWFDTLFHGFPFILLILIIFQQIFKKNGT